MIALKVERNGQYLTLAGKEDLLVLHAIVNAVGKLGPHTVEKHDRNEPPDIFLSVGGLSSISKEDKGEHSNWIEHLELTEGDKITIEVLSVEEADPVASVFVPEEKQTKC